MRYLVCQNKRTGVYHIFLAQCPKGWQVIGDFASLADAETALQNCYRD